VLTIVLPLVDRGWGGGGFILADLNPLAPVYSAGGPRSQSYFHPLAGSHLLGWFALVLAAWRAQTGWRDTEVAKSPIRWNLDWLGTNLHFGRARFARLLDAHPIGWLVRRSSRDQAMLWTAAAFATLIAALDAFWPFTMTLGSFGSFPFLVLLC
jgi:hypothetical protein